MDSVGEGEGGKIWENGVETYEMSCMKRDASPGSVHDAGCFIFFFFKKKKKKKKLGNINIQIESAPRNRSLQVKVYL